MKKTIIFILVIGLTISAIAQNVNLKSAKLFSHEIKGGNTKMPSSLNNAKDVSIYYPSAFSSCASIEHPYYWYFISEAGDTLMLTGSNPLANKCAQQYNITADVVGLAIVLENINPTGVDEILEIGVYNSDFSQMLASTNYNAATIEDSVYALYQFNFDQTVTASNFNVSLEIPLMTSTSMDLLVGATGGDTNCHSNLNKYFYYQNQWVPDDSLFNSSLKFDFMIFPIISGTVGLNDVDINTLTYVYPNPAKDQIMLASSFNINKVEIFNLMGQKVYENSLNGISLTVNVTDFTKGTYLVKMYTDGGLATKKIVVE